MSVESLWDDIQGSLKGITLLQRSVKNFSSSSRLLDLLQLANVTYFCVANIDYSNIYFIDILDFPTILKVSLTSEPKIIAGISHTVN